LEATPAPLTKLHFMYLCDDYEYTKYILYNINSIFKIENHPRYISINRQMDIARERIANMRDNTLNLSNLGLTELPPLPPTMKYLYCSFNKLTSLPPLPPKLQRLVCNDNALTELPPLPPTLIRLCCSGNKLTELPPLPHSLVYLTCYGNKLSELPHLPPTLRELYCNNNAITQLPRLPLTLGVLARDNNPIHYPPPDLFMHGMDFIRQWMDENPLIYIKSANKV
jgi:hypothetical protein